MGHTAAYPARVIFAAGPPPTTRMTSGINATDGIGRRNSTVARVATRSGATLPSNRPVGTATAVATLRAIAHASTVAITSRRNDSWVSRCAIRANTTLGGG